MAVLAVRGLTKSYGGRPPALVDVTLEVGPGVTGLLGPNGAGKSTLLQCVLGLLRGFSGEVEVLGLNARRQPRAVRRRVGFMPETEAWIPRMNGVRAVTYLGRLSGLSRSEALRRAHDVLHHVGLGEAVYRQVVEYSSGMRQRFKLAQALVHDPDLLLLDEPTSGMDPDGRDDMLRLIADLARRHGKHVIWSSHVLPEIQRSADGVVVLHGGRFQGSFRMEDLASRAGVFALEAEGDTAGLAEALARHGVRVVESGGGPEHGNRRSWIAEVAPERAADAARLMLAAAASVGARVRRVEPLAEDLATVFDRLLAVRKGAR